MKRRSRRRVALFMLVSLFVIRPLAAGDEFPRQIDRCVSCHGALGISIFDLWPNLAGQKKAYLASQLRAFRNGTRSDPWMTPMAVPLSDEDIEELARFYSEL